MKAKIKKVRDSQKGMYRYINIEEESFYKDTLAIRMIRLKIDISMLFSRCKKNRDGKIKKVFIIDAENFTDKMNKMIIRVSKKSKAGN